MEASQSVQCVGFIMDGNRRWAKNHNLPSLQGHAEGYEAFKKMIRAVHAEAIPHMICYAFSTENWNRTENEVGYLMKLLEQAIGEFSQELQSGNKKMNLKVIGQIERLPETLRNEINRVEGQGVVDPELTVWIALSYGGRAEIVDAVNRALTVGDQVTEESFEKLLWTCGMPDPDLIIRTSGEIRTSNFLIWQAAYSELFFTETLWPDFEEAEFKNILREFSTRQRRVGA